MLIDALASLAISGSAAAAGGILPSHGRLSPAGVPQPGDVFRCAGQYTARQFRWQ